MDKNCNIFSRKGIYYLRIFIPKSEQDRFGRREIWKSLKTRSRDKALATAAQHVSQYYSALERGNAKADLSELLQAKQAAQTIGIEYIVADKLEHQTTREIFERVNTVLEALNHVRNPCPAELAYLSGAIAETLTLGELFNRYRELSSSKWHDLDDRARQKKWNRYANPIVDFEKTIGEVNVLDLKPKHAFDYAAALGLRVASGEIKSETAKKKLLFLSAMVRKVFQADFPDRVNPFERASIDYEGDKTTRKPLTSDEVERIGEKLANSDANDELKAILAIAQFTGAHAKEICLLSPSDIVLDAPIPYIRIGANENRKKLKTGGARHRQIPLLGAALDAAKRHPNGFPRYCRPGGSEAFSAAANKIIQAVAPGKSTYSYRHRLVDLLRAAEGVEDSLLMSIIGHNGGITSKYGDGHSLEKKQIALEKATSITIKTT